MLQKFQSSVETQLASVASGLSSVATRMTELEHQQQALEREVNGACTTDVSSTLPRRGGGERMFQQHYRYGISCMGGHI